MRHALVAVLSFSILGSATTSVAHAQSLALKTWVSGAGLDANPCTRSQPCLTFQGAIAKTAVRGEIDVLDAGSFGQVDIAKAVTIDGNGVVAGILVTFGNGITVDAGANDVVIIRNLVINGAGIGGTGIAFFAGKQLIIENCKIFGFPESGFGMSAAGKVAISNSTISNNLFGILTRSGVVTVSHSVIMGNVIGLTAVFDGVINADSNMLTANDIAVRAGNGGVDQSAATVRLSNNDVYGNLTGFGCGGGVLASAGNNRKGSNVGGTVPTCAPTVTITLQ